MPLVGEKKIFFLRPNKNKTQPRLRPAHSDVLDGFRYVPAKTVSKIYRKHLAESTGKSRGHQEVEGRYTLGLCNWLSRPGVQEMAVGFQALGGQTHSGGGGGLTDPSGAFHWELLQLTYLFPSACA